MRIILCLIAVLVSSGVNASVAKETKITKVLAGPDYGDLVFVTVSVKPLNLPKCQSNPGHDFAFDPTTDMGKVTLELVMDAYIHQKVVQIAGGNECDNFKNVEDLKYLMLK